MSGMKKTQAYSVARVLHWFGLGVIGFNLLSGWRLDTFSQAAKEVLLMVHSGVGTIIFFLMLFRWWWRRRYKLYTPPRWWKRPSMLVQWVFYPLTLIQVCIGLSLASVISYPVVAFGLIPYSSLAPDNEQLAASILQAHGLMAYLLIVLVAVHGGERWKVLFLDSDEPAVVPVARPTPPAAEKQEPSNS